MKWVLEYAMRVALEFCSVLNVTKATEFCGNGCEEPIKIHCKWETLPMQEQPREKGFFCCCLLKSIRYYLMSVTLPRHPGFRLVTQKPKMPYPITSPIYAPCLLPYIRCDALFHCDINNHSIIVWVHTSYQEIKNLYSYLWYIMTMNDIYGSDF